MKPLNVGLSSAWKKATIRENWRSDTATLKKSMPWEEEEEEEEEEEKEEEQEQEQEEQEQEEHFYVSVS